MDMSFHCFVGSWVAAIKKISGVVIEIKTGRPDYFYNFVNSIAEE